MYFQRTSPGTATSCTLISVLCTEATFGSKPTKKLQHLTSKVSEIPFSPSILNSLSIDDRVFETKNDWTLKISAIVISSSFNARRWVMENTGPPRCRCAVAPMCCACSRCLRIRDAAHGNGLRQDVLYRCCIDAVWFCIMNAYTYI